MRLFLVAAWVMHICYAQAPDMTNPASLLWPKPQAFESSGVTFTATSSFTFQATGVSSDTLTSAFSRYKAILFPSKSSVQDAASTLTTVNVNVLSTNTDLGPHTDESYNVTVAAPVTTITANTVYGALHGIETFSQLLVLTAPGTYTGFEATVQDFPRFAVRQLMIDTARHYQPLDLIRWNIDALAMNKFSVLHWHIVDDQSFPYESIVYSNLSQGAYSPSHTYSIDDVKGIVEYAKERGIWVIPEFDTPGHSRSWGVGYPELLTKCYSNGKWDGSYGPLNPTLPGTFTFLSKLYEEIVSVFDSPYIHVGGDEVSFDCWESNPDIQAWMKQKGWTDYSKLENYYEDQLLTIVGGLNVSYIVWQEIFDNGLAINPDTIINNWKGGGWQAESSRITAANFSVILSAPFYLNYISYGEDWPKYYQIEPTNFTGTPEQKARVAGVEACLWAEYIDSTNFMSRAWPRLSAVGERMWSSVNTTDLDDASVRIHNHRCRMLDRGIPAEPPVGPSWCPRVYPVDPPAWVGM